MVGVPRSHPGRGQPLAGAASAAPASRKELLPVRPRSSLLHAEDQLADVLAAEELEQRLRERVDAASTTSSLLVSLPSLIQRAISPTASA